MDNAPYHCSKVERCPTVCWKKAGIEKWSREKGEHYDGPLSKVRFLDIVNRIILLHKYAVNEFVKSKNMTILRTLSYHCELNPIELA